MSHILQNLTESRPSTEINDIDEGLSSAGYDIITAKLMSAKRHWSSVIYEANRDSIYSDLEPKRLTHVVTAAQTHSDDSISASQISQIGTKLNDDELRISVAIRFDRVV